MSIQPESFLRLRQILGDRSVTPPIPPIVPVGKTAWWAGVKDGRFPQPVKLGPRITAWRAVDILALLDAHAARAQPEALLQRPGSAR